MRTHLELAEVLVDLDDISRDHERVLVVALVQVLPPFVLGSTTLDLGLPLAHPRALVVHVLILVLELILQQPLGLARLLPLGAPPFLLLEVVERSTFQLVGLESFRSLELFEGEAVSSLGFLDAATREADRGRRGFGPVS